MKILCFLLLAFSAGSLAGKTVCSSKPRGKIRTFYPKTESVLFPCKYPALKRQKCGKYFINLTPGNIWLGNNYYLNTLWLGINDTKTNKGWEGRTTNKIVVKYYNSGGDRELFNKKGGQLETSDLFVTDFKNNGPAAYIKEKNDTFQLTFYPWDAYNRNKHPHSYFEFECFDDDVELNPYPAQVCGGAKKTTTVKDRAWNEFGMSNNHKTFAIYYDVFMSDVVQTDEECIEAANLVQTCGSKNKTIMALKNCMEILYKDRHTECVTSFECTPMVAFNHCMRWGCAGGDEEEAFPPTETALCYEVGDAIDLCGNMAGAGSITKRMKDAGCFNEYLKITYDLNVTETD